MKKSLKKLLIIGGTLGAASVVAGSVALSSCSVNIWKNSDGSITISDQAKPEASTDDQNSSNAQGSETEHNTQNNNTHNVQLDGHHGNKHNYDKDSHKNDNLNNQQQITTNLQQLINEQKTNAELISQAKENGLDISNEVISSQVSVSITKFNSYTREASDLTDNNVDSTMGQFVLTIIDNSDKSLGTISFLNSNGDNAQSILVSPGQKVQIKATPTDGNTLVNLAVFDATSDYTLGVNKLNDQENVYEFTLPEPTLPNGEKNNFYATGTLKIVPTFAKSQLNNFIYDFNSQAYVLNIDKESYIFDDVANKDLKLIAGNKERNIQYRIYLNGHDLTIKNLTVPENTQLMFINNIDNTFSGEAPTVKLSDNTYMFGPEDGQYHDKITVKGAIGRFGSVQYGKRMSDYFEAHWATDIPELPKK